MNKKFANKENLNRFLPIVYPPPRFSLEDIVGLLRYASLGLIIVFGILFLKNKRRWLRILSFVLIILGIVGLIWPEFVVGLMIKLYIFFFSKEAPCPPGEICAIPAVSQN